MAGILGTASQFRCGKRVSFNPLKLDCPHNKTCFGIFEIPTSPDADILGIYAGQHQEEIHILFSNADRRVIGGEYWMQDIPIYYFGDKSLPCKPCEGDALGSWCPASSGQ